MNYICLWGILASITGIAIMFSVIKHKKSVSAVKYGTYLIVRSARALSNGCKSRVSPNSGNYIAKSKGVHRKVKSEGSWRQTSDLTNRNFIQGI